MKLFKMAQVDPITNEIQHISIWDHPSKAPDLVEVSDFAQIGITLQELEQLDDAETLRLELLRLELLRQETENLEDQQGVNLVT